MTRTLLMVTLLAASGANAADVTPMNEVQLDALLTGNTLYLTVPPGGAAGPEGGTVPFRYGADGTAAARLSPDTTLVGTWSLRADHYCVDWDNGPQDSCTRLLKSTDGLSLVDTDSGDVRGTVERIVPGNPEGL